VESEPEREEPEEEEGPKYTTNMIIRFPADKKGASKFNRDELTIFGSENGHSQLQKADSGYLRVPNRTSVDPPQVPSNPPPVPPSILGIYERPPRTPDYHI